MGANQGSLTVNITAFSTNHFSVFPFFFHNGLSRLEIYRQRKLPVT